MDIAGVVPPDETTGAVPVTLMIVPVFAVAPVAMPSNLPAYVEVIYPLTEAVAAAMDIAGVVPPDETTGAVPVTLVMVPSSAAQKTVLPSVLKNFPVLPTTLGNPALPGSIQPTTLPFVLNTLPVFPLCDGNTLVLSREVIQVGLAYEPDEYMPLVTVPAFPSMLIPDKVWVALALLMAILVVPKLKELDV